MSGNFSQYFDCTFLVEYILKTESASKKSFGNISNNIAIVCSFESR